MKRCVRQLCHPFSKNHHVHECRELECQNAISNMLHDNNSLIYAMAKRTTKERIESYERWGLRAAEIRKTGTDSDIDETDVKDGMRKIQGKSLLNFKESFGHLLKDGLFPGYKQIEMLKKKKDVLHRRSKAQIKSKCQQLN